MMVMNDLLKIQEEVDSLIIDKIDIRFKDTVNDRKIAFHVELGELANEIGFFKYWKKSHKKDHKRIKDEWSDCLAFLNSITITMGYNEEINKVFGRMITFLSHKNIKDYYYRLSINRLYDFVDIESAYSDLFKLGYSLGYTLEELSEAYISKSNENIRRAKEGY